MAGITRDAVCQIIAEMESELHIYRQMLAIMDGRPLGSFLPEQAPTPAQAPAATPEWVRSQQAAAAPVQGLDVRTGVRADGVRWVSCLHTDACRGKGAGRFMAEQAPKGTGVYVCGGCGHRVSLALPAAPAPTAAKPAAKPATTGAVKGEAAKAQGLCWRGDGHPVVKGRALCAACIAGK